jgi:aryl-alcohol dehydrogenase-like predicted oxidoreductase
MQYRTFGRTGWQVSEIGYGMWGMGGVQWTGSDDQESLASLERAVELGCNFFDTAYAYNDGHSETLLGQLVRRHPEQKLYTATKIPPKTRKWPSRHPLEEVFPPEYIREYVHKSLENLGLDSIDLMQFHVWEDAWAHDERWQRATDDLKKEGLIHAWGISVNRWEPDNGLETMRTGRIDAVQVIYNIFDQAPEDHLFPLAEKLNIAIIARVPFDEGTLTGTLTKDSHWPEGDWRNVYFTPENLADSVDRVEALRPLIPAGMTMPELALRFILSHSAVSTVIPGMRKLNHVETNIATSDGQVLPLGLMENLRVHRWDRRISEKWAP